MGISELYQLYRKNPIICTDTRKIEVGSIYFALKGESFDGNEFALNALNLGASFAVVDNQKFFIDQRTVLVPNVLEALQLLANYHRNFLKIPVLAITGTNGKTTTKELVRSVLAKKFSVLSTAGNLNNHIGVPLTLLSIKPEHEFAVIEMGANHPGEIEALCKIAEPNFGIITNIGKAHLEGFGGFRGVINTKNELFVYITQKQGIVFYNSDNKILTDLLIESNVEKVSFGKKSENLYGEIISADPFLHIRVISKNVNSLWHPYEVKTSLIGSYNLENILAAVSIAKYFQISEKDIIDAISGYLPSNNRSQLTKTQTNTLFIDCYNANPSSTEAALNNLYQVNSDNKIAVLGDMLELGNEAMVEHTKIIEFLVEKGMNAILVGPIYFQLAQNYNMMAFLNTDELYVYMQHHSVKNSTVLLKASRGIKLEKIIELL